MIQITPQMKIVVALEPIDFRRGIDGLAQACRAHLQADPFSGTVFVFRSRAGTSIKVLVYAGDGFWLCQKRLSKGRFGWWPSDHDPAAASARLLAHELQILLCGGDPRGAKIPSAWRQVAPSA
jgi:transposase